MGYHQNKIPKGVLGEVSKITEEYLEFDDAVQQNDKILQLCELSDLLGAIKHYTESKFNISLLQLIKFNDKTEQAFKEGKR